MYNAAKKSLSQWRWLFIIVCRLLQASADGDVVEAAKLRTHLPRLQSLGSVKLPRRTAENIIVAWSVHSQHDGLVGVNALLDLCHGDGVAIAPSEWEDILEVRWDPPSTIVGSRRSFSFIR